LENKHEKIFRKIALGDYRMVWEKNNVQIWLEKTSEGEFGGYEIARWHEATNHWDHGGEKTACYEDAIKLAKMLSQENTQ
jgi:hypothetical protein